MEDEPSAECTCACVAHGSKFALIVGHDEQAGKTATVSGSVDGDTIQVSSVVAK